MQQPINLEILQEISPAKGTKKKLNRRLTPDSSQRYRSAVQLAFLALNLIIGVQFFFFVRYFESGGHGWKVSRPPGVEGWLPIASLMHLKAFLLTMELPSIHPAGLFLLVAFLLISLLLRKAFCSWLCPVGTVSEGLWMLGRRLWRRNRQLPRGADITLRSLKYLLFGLFCYAVVSMPVPAIRAFLGGPYGVIADVKMLNFFRFVSVTGVVVIGVLVVLSTIVQNFWCRYLCPYGAMLGLLARLSPTRIVRTPENCIDCGKCTKACPSFLKVDQLVNVRSAECTACYSCVAVCPADGALSMVAGRGRVLTPRLMALGLAVIFLGFVAAGMILGHWHTEIPDEVYMDLIPRADQFGHP